MAGPIHSPHPIEKATRRDRKAIQQQSSRRCETLFIKALELSILCTVDALIVIHDHGKYKIFNSNKEESWVPSEEFLVSAKVLKPKATINC